MLHPEVAGRDCLDCMKYFYGKTGKPKEVHGYKPVRSKDARVPLECHNCPKIPIGKPKTRFQAVDFDEQTFAAYMFYQRCKTVGKFPDDEMVERVAAIVSKTEADCQRVLDRQEKFKDMLQLVTLIQGAK